MSPAATTTTTTTTTTTRTEPTDTTTTTATTTITTIIAMETTKETTPIHNLKKPKTTIDTILSLPEIVHLIGHHLVLFDSSSRLQKSNDFSTTGLTSSSPIASPTLYKALFVSRNFYFAWLPLLWETVTIHHWGSEGFVKGLSKHGGLIRRLTCSRYDDIEQLGDGCRNLRFLDLPLTTVQNQSSQARLVDRNRDLHSLSLLLSDDQGAIKEESRMGGGGGGGKKWGQESEQQQPHALDLMVQAMSNLNCLEVLKLDGSTQLKEETLEQLLQCTKKSVRHVSLQKIFFFRHPFGDGSRFRLGRYDDADDHDDNDDNVKDQRQLQQQEEEQGGTTTTEAEKFKWVSKLSLDGVGCDSRLILNLGFRFPNLTFLSFVEGCDFFPNNSTFCPSLSESCPRLIGFDFSKQEELGNEFFVSLCQSFPFLQTLRVSETGFSQEAMESLVKNCSRLQELDISICYGIESESIQLLLEKSRYLKRLEGWEVQLNAFDIVFDVKTSRPRPPWACLEIETLILDIDYCPPVPVFVNDSSSSLSLFGDLEIKDQVQAQLKYRREQKQLVRKAFVNQLSRLISLRQLGLGKCCNHDPDELDTENDQDMDAQGNLLPLMDFSLSSGDLQSLISLNQLEYLNLVGMKHEIRQAEVEWIYQFWPKLQRIEGFDIRDDEEDEDAEDYVAPDVSHIEWLQKMRPGLLIDLDY